LWSRVAARADDSIFLVQILSLVAGHKLVFNVCVTIILDVVGFVSLIDHGLKQPHVVASTLDARRDWVSRWVWCTFCQHHGGASSAKGVVAETGPS
jgi:hypothetical protein